MKQFIRTVESGSYDDKFIENANLMLFRAKHTKAFNDDSWYYGHYSFSPYSLKHFLKVARIKKGVGGCENGFLMLQIDPASVGQLICKDKYGSDVWSNSKVKYFGKIYELKYITNGWYIDDISYPNFDEKDIETVSD